MKQIRYHDLTDRQTDRQTGKVSLSFWHFLNRKNMKAYFACSLLRAGYAFID